eukprot:gene459-549_t
MVQESESRFAYLLQPIRDLTENWNIDISKELEDYLGELSKISFTFGDANKSLNFAEAALLIQGSAVIYSKKVEYLYNLLYQTLDHLADRRKRKEHNSSLDKDGNDRDTLAMFNNGPEFLPLDDALQEATDIDLNDNNVGLAGLDDGDDNDPGDPRKKRERAKRLREKRDKDNGDGDHTGSNNLLPSNPVHMTMMALSSDNLGEEGGERKTNYGVNNFFPSRNGELLASRSATSFFEMSQLVGLPTPTYQTPRKAALKKPKSNPWAMLDPHEESSSDRPYKRGKTYRIPASLAKEGGKARATKDTQKEDASLTFGSSNTIEFPRENMSLKGCFFKDLAYIYTKNISQQRGEKMHANKVMF